MSLYRHEREGNVDELLTLLEDSGTVNVRKRAAEVLGDVDAPDEEDDIVDALVTAAREDDPEVSAAAIDALDSRGQDAIEQLIGSLAGIDFEDDQAGWTKVKACVGALDADVPELRMAAANALGRLDDSDAVGPLTERLSDGDPRVRARAARALGKLGDPRAEDALVARLEDGHVEVRREAAEALGSIGTQGALTALLDMLEDDSETVRRIAVDAFGNFGSAEPVDHLIEALGDEAATVRRTAVFSLIELLSSVPTEQSHDIRETVVSKLNQREDPTVLEPLVEILEESREAPQRRNTTWLLGRVTAEGEQERVVEALVEALADDDRMTAQFAATSLGNIGGDLVEDALLEVLEDEDLPATVRGQAVFTLGEVGGEDARQRLDTLIDETEEDAIRQKAFAAISKLGGRV